LSKLTEFGLLKGGLRSAGKEVLLSFTPRCA
jgi:hypothetical protein